MKLRLTRTVTTIECPWLNHDLEKGTVVEQYTGPTYGCVTSHGTACVTVGWKGPFFEVPTSALKRVE